MIDISSNVFLTIRDKDWNLLETRSAKNLVVNCGLQLVRDMLGGTGYRLDQMQVGTGTSATAPSNTTLGTSVLTKDIDRRIQLTYGIEFQTLIDIDEANGYTLSEIGTFQQNTMVARALISPTISKTDAIQVTLSHVFTISAS